MATLQHATECLPSLREFKMVIEHEHGVTVETDEIMRPIDNDTYGCALKITKGKKTIQENFTVGPKPCPKLFGHEMPTTNWPMKPWIDEAMKRLAK